MNQAVDCVGVNGSTLVFEIYAFKVFYEGTMSGNTMTGPFIQNGTNVTMTFQH